MQHEPYLRIALWSHRPRKLVGFATVDSADYDSLVVYGWFLNSNGYACRGTNEGRAILMHRSIMGLVYGDGRVIDHINRDKLDNRRSNLRVVTHAQNMQNVVSRAGTSSRYRGVYWAKDKQRWRARVGLGGRQYRHLGYFRSEDEAGAAAAAAIAEYLPFSAP